MGSSPFDCTSIPSLVARGFLCREATLLPVADALADLHAAACRSDVSNSLFRPRFARPYESLRLHPRRRQANSATAPRTSGSCLLLHLTSPLRVAQMQDVHSLLFFRFAAKLSLVHSFSLRGSGFRRRLIQARGGLCREATLPLWLTLLYPSQNL